MNNLIFINDIETDSESYDSFDDTDDETDYGEIIYDPEENTRTKFNIVICEKYDKTKHELCNDNIYNYYITLIRFKYLDINIVKSFLINNNAKLEIAKCIHLNLGYYISIIKTFWLKLIQRKWKKIYKERKMCLLKRANTNVIKYREIYGKWPESCLNYPLLKGMLSDLTCRRSRTST